MNEASGPFAEFGQAAQAFVLVLEAAGGGLPGEQPGILLAQACVLLAQRGEFLQVGDGAVGHPDRPGDRLEHRGGEIERDNADMLDQHRVGLADQHDAERSDDEQAERKPLHGRTHLASDYLEVVPDRHVPPILPLMCELVPLVFFAAHSPLPGEAGEEGHGWGRATPVARLPCDRQTDRATGVTRLVLMTPPSPITGAPPRASRREGV